MIDIVTKRFGMEDFCEKNQRKNLCFRKLQVYNLLLY